VHDEPEVVTGDKDPVGEDGQGTSTHAFDGLRRREKELEERLAVSVLEEAMRPSLRAGYRALMEELLGEASQEARFVKAVDKLQALAFVRLVKQGRITPEHTAFTIRYARTGVSKFPYLQSHFNCVLIDLLNDVAASKAYALSDFCLATRNKLESASRK
jgi:5'-deoxynucleotidase YfbR-like HD superfamily hydrolase